VQLSPPRSPQDNAAPPAPGHRWPRPQGPGTPRQQRSLVALFVGLTIAMLAQNTLIGVGRYIWKEGSGFYLVIYMLVGTMLCAVLLGLRVRPVARVGLFCLPMLAVMCISHATAAFTPTEYGRLSWLMAITDIVVFLAALFVGQREDIVRAFIWTGAIVAVVGGIASLHENASLGGHFGYDPLLREAGTGGPATGAYLGIGRALAMTAAPSIVFCLSEMTISGSLLLNLGALVFATAVMMVGGGRSPAIGLVLMVLAALTMRIMRISRRRQLALLAALILLSGLMSTSHLARKMATGQRIAEMAAGRDTSTSARWKAKTQALQLIGQSPIIGQGSGTFDALSGSSLVYPHDLFLEVAADYGLFVSVPGLLGCLWLLRTYYRRMRSEAPWVGQAQVHTHVSLFLLLVFWVSQIPFMSLPTSTTLFAVAGLCVGVLRQPRYAMPGAVGR
jgi:O-antigen ligase